MKSVDIFKAVGGGNDDNDDDVVLQPNQLGNKHDKAVAKITNSNHFKNQLLAVIQNVL